MLICVSLAVILFLLSSIYDTVDNEKTKRFLWFFSCILVLFVLGFRSYRTGTDTTQYVRRFLIIKETPFLEVLKIDYKDMGFIYLTKIVSYFIRTRTGYLLVMSFLELIGVFYFIGKTSVRPILALYFFVTFGNFFFCVTGMRQAVSMSICLLATHFVDNKKLIPFVALVVLASTIHGSAFVFLPIYFVGRIDVTPKFLAVESIVTGVSVLFYARLLEYANKLLGYEYTVEELNNGYYNFLIILAIAIIGYLTKEDWAIDKKNMVVLNMGVICAILWVFRLIGRTAERPAMYYLNAIPCVLTNSFFNLNKSKEDTVVKFLISIAIFALFLKRMVGWKYAFFWD